MKYLFSLKHHFNFLLLSTISTSSFALPNVPLREEVIYKCKQNDSTILYSNAPCATQAASKIKVLRIDQKQLNIYESNFDPAENPANRPLTREEQRKFFIPEASEVYNLDYLKAHPVAKIKMPALEAMEKSYLNFKTSFYNLIETIKIFFYRFF